ncbi:hypothetical protein CVT26_006366 [Gymnopilus dilepis]|uniref:Translocation protein sec66 n=1 Tax=Gymnopilus dilepis TaxID=231916 RepID=A0A409W665_9AGAR|nr:hypothetical protein CVT26_006366 [Gymnopilus dilepis]
MASVLVPVAYVIIIFGGLFVFSYFYRKHTSTKVFEPYFPSHPERNAYISLLQKTDPPAHDTLLKAALVRRAMADVQRVLRIREDKPALQNLLQKGSIGDDVWNSLLAAEKEIEIELMDVVAEANSFVDGWGQIIFPVANEMLANEKMRAAYERINDTKAEIVAKYELRSPKTLIDTSETPSKSANGLLSPTSPSDNPTSDNEGSATSKSGKKTKKRK